MNKLGMTTVLIGTLAITMMNGCHNKLVGSWEGSGQPSDAPLQFTSMTFAPDGTFTAEAAYADSVRAVTGTWSTKNNMLELEGGRKYGYSIKNDHITFEDPGTGQELTLQRVR